jgi:ATP-dependent Clp protease ATP-binding subunit ClpB
MEVRREGEAASARPMPTPMRAGLNLSLDPDRRAHDVKQLHDKMLRRVVGQDHAVDVIVEAYEEFKAGLHPATKPIANLLFLGPTGVGKTNTVESMVESIFGDRRAMVKIDCAEFQHSHEIAKLIGSPPGYLGHRETHPLLTQESLNQWHTVETKLSFVLFDEIEKASDGLWNLLLGILDKGTLTLGDNRRVDFTKTIIVMTSNVGAAQMVDSRSIGLTTDYKEERTHDKLEEIALRAARTKFSPEFLNRIDKMVVFHSLTEEDVEHILEIELGRLQQRVLQATSNIQFVFTVNPEAKKVLLTEGYSRAYGARELNRVIETRIARPLSRLLSSKQLKLGDFVRIGYDGEKFTFTKEAEGALVPVLLEKYGIQGDYYRKPQ